MRVVEIVGGNAKAGSMHEADSVDLPEEEDFGKGLREHHFRVRVMFGVATLTCAVLFLLTFLVSVISVSTLVVLLVCAWILLTIGMSRCVYPTDGPGVDTKI